jgi:hypothetical protein
MANPIHAGTAPMSGTTHRISSPSYQAYQILHWGFVAAPLIAGIDKFVHLLVNWDQYLTPLVPRLTGIPAHTFMSIVGVIEIIAALLVAWKPRIGAYVVALWLAGIIVNLLLVPGYYDVALRDFGLFLGALALGRLSQDFDGSPITAHTETTAPY